MGFKVDVSEVIKNLSELEMKMRSGVALVADTGGKKLEAWAKTNAPWQDRSGKARQTIEGGYEWIGSVCRIYVAGNTDYFPYLEFCNELKYATLWPAIKALEGEILEGFEKMF